MLILRPQSLSKKKGRKGEKWGRREGEKGGKNASYMSRLINIVVTLAATAMPPFLFSRLRSSYLRWRTLPSTNISWSINYTQQPWRKSPSKRDERLMNICKWVRLRCPYAPPLEAGQVAMRCINNTFSCTSPRLYSGWRSFAIFADFVLTLVGIGFVNINPRHSEPRSTLFCHLDRN